MTILGCFLLSFTSYGMLVALYALSEGEANTFLMDIIKVKSTHLASFRPITQKINCRAVLHQKSAG